VRQPAAAQQAGAAAGITGSDAPARTGPELASGGTPGGAASASQGLKPTLGLDASGEEQWRRARPMSELSEAELKKYGPQIEKYKQAWERHVAPLLYPPGHPREGTYRDSVGLEDAVEAQMRYQEETLPPGYLDKPWLHIKKRVPYQDVNVRQETWDYEDIASNRAFYDWLLEQPEDPKAYRGDFWIPADPNDPDATTRRESLEQRIRDLEGPGFAARGG
jgi:hypothetical protein